MGFVCCVTQVGLDDVLHAWFQQSSIQTGGACLETSVIPRCRSALQTGAQPALRPRLWATALALDLPQAVVETRFQSLCSQVEECNLLTDLLVGFVMVTMMSCCSVCRCRCPSKVAVFNLCMCRSHACAHGAMLNSHCMTKDAVSVKCNPVLRQCMLMAEAWQDARATYSLLQQGVSSTYYVNNLQHNS